MSTVWKGESAIEIAGTAIDDAVLGARSLARCGRWLPAGREVQTEWRFPIKIVIAVSWLPNGADAADDDVGG